MNSNKTRHSLLALALAATFALAGCGDDEKKDSGGSGSGTTNTTQSETAGGDKYPQQVVDNFMKSCTAQPGATDAYCKCTIEELQAKLPFDKFKNADQAIQNDKKADPEAQKAIQDAIKTCRK